MMIMCEKVPYCNRKIDDCMKEIVEKINLEGKFKTLLCCCGHGKYHPSIIVKNKEGEIFEYFSMKKLERKKRKRYYKCDDKGYYFVAQLAEHLAV